MRGFWFTLLIAAVISLSFNVWAATGFKPTPLPYSCSQVRWAYKHFTREHLLQIASTMGIVVTAAQRHQAEKCVGGKYG
jgi:hypothetical protein